MEMVRCNNCMWIGIEDDLIQCRDRNDGEITKACPQCETDHYLMDIGFVLCRSDQGDGGWSLHAPDSTDEEIASGDAPYLVAGPAEYDDDIGDWNRPNEADYRKAAEVRQNRKGE